MKRFLTLATAAIIAICVGTSAYARNCLTETPLPDKLSGYSLWTGVMQTTTWSGQPAELCRTLAAATTPDGTVKAVESWGKNSINTVNAGSFEFTGKIVNGVLTHTTSDTGATSTYTFLANGNVKMSWERTVTFRGEPRIVKGETVLTKTSSPSQVSVRQ